MQEAGGGAGRQGGDWNTPPHTPGLSPRCPDSPRETPRPLTSPAPGSARRRPRPLFLPEQSPTFVDPPLRPRPSAPAGRPPRPAPPCGPGKRAARTPPAPGTRVPLRSVRHLAPPPHLVRVLGAWRRCLGESRAPRGLPRPPGTSFRGRRQPENVPTTCSTSFRVPLRK